MQLVIWLRREAGQRDACMQGALHFFFYIQRQAHERRACSTRRNHGVFPPPLTIIPPLYLRGAGAPTTRMLHQTHTHHWAPLSIINAPRPGLL